MPKPGSTKKIKKKVSFVRAPSSEAPEDEDKGEAKGNNVPAFTSEDISSLLSTLSNIGNLKTNEESEEEKRKKETRHRLLHPSPSIQSAQQLASDTLVSALDDFVDDSENAKMNIKSKTSKTFDNQSEHPAKTEIHEDRATSKTNQKKAGVTGDDITDLFNTLQNIGSLKTAGGVKTETPDRDRTSQSAEKLTSDTLVSALDDFVDDNEKKSRRNNVKTKSKVSKKPKSPKSGKYGIHASLETHRKTHLRVEPKVIVNQAKPWYSSSSFDKSAADFLSEESPNSSVHSSSITLDSRASRSFTSASSSGCSSKLSSENIKSDTKHKGAKTAGDDVRHPAIYKSLLSRRHTSPTSKPQQIMVRGSKMSQHEKPTASRKLADKKRCASIDMLTNYMLPLDEDAEERSSLSANREAQHPIEEVVREVIIPPKISADINEVFPKKKLAEKKPKRRAIRSKSEPSKPLDISVDKSELNVNLNETQMATFRKLFSRFDQTKSGGISGKELYDAIVDLLPDMDVSFREVENVLKEFDIKETGEIEFDEFLFAMTHPKNYLKLMSDDDREQLQTEIKIWEEVTKRKMSQAPTRTILKKRSGNGDYNGVDRGRNLFFTMLKTATKKDSMKEIRQYYVNRIKKLNDHVIHDWSAGQRCIGLSHQEMMKRYDHINRELKDEKSPFACKQEYKDSPYAQPLRWGFNQLKQDEAFKKKALQRKSTRTYVGRTKSTSRILKPKVQAEGTDRPKSAHSKGQPSDEELQFQEEDLMRHLARPNIKRRMKTDKAHDELKRTYSTPAKKVDRTIPYRRAASAKKRNAPLRRPKISEFVCTPKVVPLPKYPLQVYPQTFDYDDLPEIRHKAAIILEDYYNDLKKVAATNSRTIYKQLQVEQMRPMMRNHFKQSYLAYSGDYEPFVVSPWIPFPTPSPWIPYPPLGKSQPKSAWT